MSKLSHKFLSASAAVAFSFIGGAAVADSISPLTYTNDTLGVGESVTISKTVTVSAGSPTEATIDVMFLIDTSGSMGAAINNAKAAAGDILTALGGFGDVASGVGVFSEEAAFPGTPPGSVINKNVDTNNAATQTAIGNVTLNVPDGGGDYPERGQDATNIVASNATWRPGSNRFIIALGDASWKNDVVSDAVATASLGAANVSLIGLDFCATSGTCTGFFDSDSDDLTFKQSVEDLGGTVFAGGTTAADLVAAITAGITAGFAEYDEVTVDDLGGGSPEIDVTAVCTGADIGACVGDKAVGDYDRSVERTFTFDVTFTRTAAGDTVFPTFALVDGGIVAREIDTFGGTSVVPLPAAGWLLIAGLGGLAAMRRRKQAA